MRISDWSSDVCSSDLSFKAKLQSEAFTGLRPARAFSPAEKDPKRLAPGARRCGSCRTDPLRFWATAGRRRTHTSLCSNSGAFPLRLPAMLAVLYGAWRSEEHTSELQSLMRISYAVF